MGAATDRELADKGGNESSYVGTKWRCVLFLPVGPFEEIGVGVVGDSRKGRHASRIAFNTTIDAWSLFLHGVLPSSNGEAV